MAQEQSPLLQCKRDCVLRIEDKVASVCYSNQGLGCEIVPIQIGVLKHSLLTLWAGVRIRYLLLGIELVLLETLDYLRTLSSFITGGS